MKKLTFILTLLLSGSIGNSQETEINHEVVEKITQGLYTLPAQGSYTTIFSGKDGLLIIDTGMEFEGARSDSIIRAEFKKPIRYLLNSHSHLDHTGGNKFFAHKETIIIGHENVRNEMLKEWKATEI